MFGDSGGGIGRAASTVMATSPAMGTATGVFTVYLYVHKKTVVIFQ